MLVNQNGIVFGNNARIDVGALIATTHDIANQDFLAGRLNFNIAGRPDAAITNLGNITAADRGLVALVAPSVRNDGVIVARLGKIALAAGGGFTVDMYGDDLIQLIVDEAHPAAQHLVTNTGRLSADGGYVLLTASSARDVVDSVVNTSGIIEARSIGEINGEIVLLGDDASTVNVAGALNASGNHRGETGGRIIATGEMVTVAEGAHLNADGASGGGRVLVGGDYLGGQVTDPAPHAKATLEPETAYTARTTTIEEGSTLSASATQSGDGGKVIVWSDEQTLVDGRLLALGAGGDDGGFIETSSAGQLGVGVAEILAGQGGLWLLDPTHIQVTDFDSDSGDFRFINAATINSSLNVGSSVVLRATGTTATIMISEDIVKSRGSDASITLESEGSVTIANADIISTAGKLDVSIITAQQGDRLQAFFNPGLLRMTNSVIRTNGGDFQFSGAFFESQDVEFPLIGALPPGRIISDGGDIALAFSPLNVSGFSPSGLFGCVGATTNCGGTNFFTLEAGSGDVFFSSTQSATNSNRPVITIGDFGLRTTGNLHLNQVVLSSTDNARGNGLHNIEFGALILSGNAQIDLTDSDAPNLQEALDDNQSDADDCAANGGCQAPPPPEDADAEHLALVLHLWPDFPEGNFQAWKATNMSEEDSVAARKFYIKLIYSPSLLAQNEITLAQHEAMFAEAMVSGAAEGLVFTAGIALALVQEVESTLQLPQTVLEIYEQAKFIEEELRKVSLEYEVDIIAILNYLAEETGQSISSIPDSVSNASPLERGMAYGDMVLTFSPAPGKKAEAVAKIAEDTSKLLADLRRKIESDDVDISDSGKIVKKPVDGDADVGSVAKGLGDDWKPKNIADPKNWIGCEECARDIQSKIGGKIFSIKPVSSAPVLSVYRGVSPNWHFHEVVVKDGRVYDAFGPMKWRTNQGLQKSIRISR